MCRWLIKKVSKKYKDIYNVFASRSKSENIVVLLIIFVVLYL